MSRKANEDLTIVTLRLRKADLKTARGEAKKLGVPYQVLIRQWLAEYTGALVEKNAKPAAKSAKPAKLAAKPAAKPAKPSVASKK